MGCGCDSWVVDSVWSRVGSYVSRAAVYRWVRHLPMAVVVVFVVALFVLVLGRWLFGPFRRKRGYR